ncbi:MAG TPA: peptidylprolyl isomerase [Saprospiraceae bacterium]|nr:peptidylprolyl isomerase [Saprospiraceae bacterium]HMQ84727.1 peptidylprolyl isomerase [Saprospiraceae bacterium]
MKYLFIGLALVLTFGACQSDGYTYAVIETEYGNMKVMLYNSTPQHRDNFIKLAKEGFYDSLLFHRVVADFMIQGGDPDSRYSPTGQPLGMGGPGYTLAPEIGAPHLKGTLAAARLSDDVNPGKESSGSQFYIVEGQVFDDAMLDQIEHQKGIKYNPQQRALYKEIGGTPFLDNDYTVFGEVVKGIEVIEKIASQPTDPRNRPMQDIRMKIRIL